MENYDQVTLQPDIIGTAHPTAAEMKVTLAVHEACRFRSVPPEVIL